MAIFFISIIIERRQRQQAHPSTEVARNEVLGAMVLVRNRRVGVCQRPTACTTYSV
jgi:hypothetical protein